MRLRNPTLEEMIDILIDAGEIIRHGDMFFEDMGGHMITDLNIPIYFLNYAQSLSQEERLELMNLFKEDQ